MVGSKILAKVETIILWIACVITWLLSFGWYDCGFGEGAGVVYRLCLVAAFFIGPIILYIQYALTAVTFQAMADVADIRKSICDVKKNEKTNEKTNESPSSDNLGKSVSEVVNENSKDYVWNHDS